MENNLFRKAYKYKLNGVPIMGTSIDIKTYNINVDKVINVYKSFHSVMPYPLIAIEEDIKYCTIAVGIHNKIPNIEVWVDDGLCVEMDRDEHIAIRIKGNYYQTYKYKNKPTKDIIEYMNSDLFKEFNWVAERWANGKTVKDFYMVFMKDTLKSIKKDKKKFEIKLMNMLDYEEVKGLHKLKNNTVIDGDDNYTLDIFKVEYETGNTIEDIVIEGRKVTTRQIKETNSYYDYEAYLKTGNEKMKNVESIGMGAIFEILVSREKLFGWLDFKGVVINDILYFEVDNNIFKSNFKLYSVPELIATRASLFGFNDKSVYITQTSKYDDVKREVIYRIDGDDFIPCKERLFR